MSEQDKMVNSEAEVVEVKVPCEVYSRVVGYLRPTQNWNQGKQQEFSDRQAFEVPAHDEA